MRGGGSARGVSNPRTGMGHGGTHQFGRLPDRLRDGFAGLSRGPRLAEASREFPFCHLAHSGTKSRETPENVRHIHRERRELRHNFAITAFANCEKKSSAKDVAPSIADQKNRERRAII